MRLVLVREQKCQFEKKKILNEIDGDVGLVGWVV